MDGAMAKTMKGTMARQQQQWQWQRRWQQRHWWHGQSQLTTTALQQIVGENEVAMVKGNCDETNAIRVIVQNAGVANKGCNS